MNPALGQGRLTSHSEPRLRSCRPMVMATASLVGLALGVIVLVGCATEDPVGPTTSGVAGLVHLGPQCAVERADEPCEDEPAAGVTVTVSHQIPGEAYVAGEFVARGTTGPGGGFRIAVAPGDYVVTAEAGMSCELMDAHVTDETYAQVDIPCDTGIR